MQEERDRYDRREFIERGAKAIATAAFIGTGLAGCGDGDPDSQATQPEPDARSAPEAQDSQDAAIPARPFGDTGVSLPLLGFGGAAVVEHFGNTRSFAERVRVVRRAYDRGVRYFDTAHRLSYGESQLVLKEALHNVRDDVFLTSKVDFWNAGHPDGILESLDTADVTRQVDEILTDLGVDHVDAVLLHGTPGVEQMTVDQALEVSDALDRERAKGKLRFVGFSAHHYFDKAQSLIASGSFDLCMLAYGYVPRGLSRRFSGETMALRDACVQDAYDRGMGIVAMKVVGGGMLSGFPNDVISPACRYALQDTRISNFTIGMSSEDEVEQNVSTFIGDLTYTQEDESLLADAFAVISDADWYQQMPEA